VHLPQRSLKPKSEKAPTCFVFISSHFCLISCRFFLGVAEYQNTGGCLQNNTQYIGAHQNQKQYGTFFLVFPSPLDFLIFLLFSPKKEAPKSTYAYFLLIYTFIIFGKK
jgi:hypothetical protein